MERSASCVICDDVRVENTGKLNYIGVYTGDMFVSSIPLTLPKLFFVVKLKSSVDDPYRSMTVRIERPKDEDFISETTEFKGADRKKLRGSKAQFHVSLQVHEIAPFEVKAEGVIKAWVKTEREEVHATTLQIRLPPEPHQTLDFGAIVSVIDHYRRISVETEGDKEGLAEAMLEYMHSMLPSGVLPPSGERKDLIIPIGPNKFRVFFRTPMLATPKLKFPLEHKLIYADKFGFEVSFKPSAGKVRSFDFTANAER